jgi:hypothetical protein
MSSGPFEVTESQAAAVEKMAKLIARFSLTLPAIMTLESMRPLAFVGSQFMHVMSPAATMLLPFAEWDQVAHLMEDRRGVEYVITAIERADAKRKVSEHPAHEEANQ